MRDFMSIRRAALLGGIFVILGTALSPATPAPASAANDKIPDLASISFAWLADNADWQEPPAGTAGHGRIAAHPDHPLLNNAQARRLGVQPTLRIGNDTDPVLKPWAAAAMKASNEEALAGKVDVPFAAQARCWPGGVPGQLLYPAEPVYFIQTPKEVWMIWQRDHMVRRVFLNGTHTTNPKPQAFGESIGHYEGGDTLVVDTIGLATHNSFIDNFRTPHSEKEHVVERFTVSPDGKTLTAVVMVEDPDTFNEPLHMQNSWHKVPNPLAETVCAENNNDSLFFHQKLAPMPEATSFDF